MSGNVGFSENFIYIILVVFHFMHYKLIKNENENKIINSLIINFYHITIL